MTNECQNCLSKWRFRRECVHDTTDGFEDPNNASKVCKLKRSIYGLKQASRSWNKRFDKEIKEFGFIKCDEEPCAYKRFSESIIVFIILYVDDILLIGNDISTLDKLKSSLKKVFSMKDLGEAQPMFWASRSIEIDLKKLIGLSQGTYIDKVLKRFNIQYSKKENLPMSHDINLGKKHCPSTNAELETMKKCLPLKG
jgi:Reverse transcriptase (RNA-dependent DNA polymerase)